MIKGLAALPASESQLTQQVMRGDALCHPLTKNGTFPVRKVTPKAANPVRESWPNSCIVSVQALASGVST